MDTAATPFDVSTLPDKEARLRLLQLADRFEMDLEPRKPRVDWARYVASGHALENADGTIVLRLHHPVEMNGDKVTRATVRRVTVKDMRFAQIGERVDTATLTEGLVPSGLFNALESIEDADLFLAAGGHQLGKFTGRSATSSAPSASSAVTSASPRVI